MNNIFQKFIPQEPKFFPILREMSEVINRAAELMTEFIKYPDRTKDKEFYKAIKDQEWRGDALVDKIFDELNTTFITPFDREDINALAVTMDDVIDFINSCAKRIMLYKPKYIPSAAIPLAELVKEAASTISEAVDELHDLKKRPEKIKESCKLLHTIENKADDVYEEFLIQLFEKETDAIEVIKLKDILHELEKATDKAEGVGKIIKTIIVKYA